MNIILQLQLRIVLLALLHFVPEQVQLVLTLLGAEVHVTHLASLDLQLTVKRRDRLLVLEHSAVRFGLLLLEARDLVLTSA